MTGTALMSVIGILLAARPVLPVLLAPRVPLLQVALAMHRLTDAMSVSENAVLLARGRTTM